MSEEQRGPRLENRLPAEGINSSSEHPLKEFAWLIVASGVTLLVLMALASWGARWLAPQLPFSAEVALAQRLVERLPDGGHGVLLGIGIASCGTCLQQHQGACAIA